MCYQKVNNNPYHPHAGLAMNAVFIFLSKKASSSKNLQLLNTGAKLK